MDLENFKKGLDVLEKHYIDFDVFCDNSEFMVFVDPKSNVSILEEMESFGWCFVEKRNKNYKRCWVYYFF